MNSIPRELHSFVYAHTYVGSSCSLKSFDLCLFLCVLSDVNADLKEGQVLHDMPSGNSQNEKKIFSLLKLNQRKFCFLLACVFFENVFKAMKIY